MTAREYRVGVDLDPRGSLEADEFRRWRAALTASVQHRAVKAEDEVFADSGVALFKALATIGVKFATEWADQATTLKRKWRGDGP